MNDSKYKNLCAKAISGQITPQEKQKLDEWINKSSANQAYYDQICETWNLTLPATVPVLPDAEEDWASLAQILNLETEKVKRSISSRGFKKLSNLLGELFAPRYRPAVLSFVSVVIAAIGLLLLKDQIFETQYQRIYTFNKQRMQITLSDGTLIYLNSDSFLKFRKTFTDTIRQVFLTGEAFFEVAHDERPFTVITENAITTVLGTKFNVRARNEETRVIVKEGRVRLQSADDDNGDVILSKDQMGQIRRSVPPESPKTVDAEQRLGWLENKLVFVKAPLNEILGELERYYDISIESMDRELNQKTITATFDDLPVETVLSSICLTLNVQYQSDDETYRITPMP